MFSRCLPSNCQLENYAAKINCGNQFSIAKLSTELLWWHAQLMSFICAITKNMHHNKTTRVNSSLSKTHYRTRIFVYRNNPLSALDVCVFAPPTPPLSVSRLEITCTDAQCESSAEHDENKQDDRRKSEEGIRDASGIIQLRIITKKKKIGEIT